MLGSVEHESQVESRPSSTYTTASSPSFRSNLDASTSSVQSLDGSAHLASHPSDRDSPHNFAQHHLRAQTQQQHQHHHQQQQQRSQQSHPNASYQSFPPFASYANTQVPAAPNPSLFQYPVSAGFPPATSYADMNSHPYGSSPNNFFFPSSTAQAFPPSAGAPIPPHVEIKTESPAGQSPYNPPHGSSPRHVEFKPLINPSTLDGRRAFAPGLSLPSTWASQHNYSASMPSSASFSYNSYANPSFVMPNPPSLQLPSTNDASQAGSYNPLSIYASSSSAYPIITASGPGSSMTSSSYGHSGLASSSSSTSLLPDDGETSPASVSKRKRTLKQDPSVKLEQRHYSPGEQEDASSDEDQETSEHGDADYKTYVGVAPSAGEGGATGSAGENGDRPKNKDKIDVACFPCRQRKIKCDSARPVCVTCQRRQISCDYPEKRRFRGPGKKKKEKTEKKKRLPKSEGNPDGAPRPRGRPRKDRSSEVGTTSASTGASGTSGDGSGSSSGVAKTGTSSAQVHPSAHGMLLSPMLPDQQPPGRFTASPSMLYQQQYASPSQSGYPPSVSTNPIFPHLGNAGELDPRNHHLIPPSASSSLPHPSAPFWTQSPSAGHSIHQHYVSTIPTLYQPPLPPSALSSNAHVSRAGFHSHPQPSLLYPSSAQQASPLPSASSNNALHPSSYSLHSHQQLSAPSFGFSLGDDPRLPIPPSRQQQQQPHDLVQNGGKSFTLDGGNGTIRGNASEGRHSED